jgi:hypothetical protein
MTLEYFAVSSSFLRRANPTPEYVQEAKNDGYTIIHTALCICTCRLPRRYRHFARSFIAEACFLYVLANAVKGQVLWLS